MEKKRIAQYRIIEQDLRDSITVGAYKQGDMIPTELELSEAYGVSRVTVRKATDNLVAQDILQRVAGVGTFVKNAAIRAKVPGLMGFTDEITGMGMTPRTQVVAFQLMRVPDKLYHTLGLEKDDMVYHIERIRYANDIPFVKETTYMSARLYPGMSMEILSGSKYHYFEDVLGLKIAYSQHTVTPILPSGELRKLFSLPAQQPIVKVGNITFLENGQVMDFTQLLMNSPKFQLRYIKQ